MQDKKIKKLIYLNAYPYGVPQYLPIDESHPLEPHSPYNSSKIIAENLLFSYLNNITKVISLRVFNIYGKYQLQNFLIPNIISQIKESDKVILNDLRPKRDFLYIQDLIILLNNIILDTNNIGIYNVGYGRSYSIKEVVDAISIAFNKRIALKTIQKKRQNEILDLYADINKVKSSFNWSPKFSILDGMKHYYKNEKIDQKCFLILIF